MKALSQCPRQGLPIDLHVASASVVNDHAVYHCTLYSMTTETSWSVAYRYSELHAFKRTVEKVLTCDSPKCSGSCQAIRDYMNACFPKKHALFSTSQRTRKDRQLKLENVLLHLLRCVLLPGSAMKCASARRALPPHLFEFLGVQHALDRRSLLQIYVDNYQRVLKHSPFSRPSASSASSSRSSEADAETETSCCRCMICLEDVDENATAVADSQDGEDDDTVALPCTHVFHRECVFEWLLFEFHCPLCRSRVGPAATTNFCRAKNRVQWWIGELESGPLRRESTA